MIAKRLRSSPSFLVAVAVIVLGLGGYAARSFLRPDPYVFSERIVRDARRTLASEVRDFQRELGTLTRKGGRGGQEDLAAIDKRVAEALKGIDEQVEDAREQLIELDIAVRTQRNRLERIRARAQEAKEMVEELAEEARAKARGD